MSQAENQHAKTYSRYSRRTGCRRSVSGHKAQNFEEGSVGREQQGHKVACTTLAT